MIKYQLKCADDHEFEGWFRNSADFDEQAEDGLLECPVCGAASVSKAIMAPAIARHRPGGKAPASATDPRTEATPEKPILQDSVRLAEMRRDFVKAAERARAYVEKHFDNVGDRFPEEARKIHYGESEERGIYGNATGEEVRDLMEEGVSIAPLPSPRKKAEVVKREKAKKLN